MCDMPSAFSTVTRKARKQHLCFECKTEIKPGDMYQYSSGIWDGTPNSFKQCLNCWDIFNAATNSAGYEDEGPSFGRLKEWFEEFQCRGYTGKEWLDGMSAQIGVDQEKLNMLLRVQHHDQG